MVSGYTHSMKLNCYLQSLIVARVHRFLPSSWKTNFREESPARYIALNHVEYQPFHLLAV
jgi:hypothetical protein